MEMIEGDTVRQVFISHAEEDHGLAVQLAEALEDLGIATWYYERDSLPGVPHLIQTARAIDDAAAFLIVVSPAAISSPAQVEGELLRAQSKHKHILPMLSGITHAEFEEQAPLWAVALGAAVSVPVKSGGVGAIVPKVIASLRLWGIDGLSSSAAPAVDERSRPAHEPEPQVPAGRSPDSRVVLVAVLVGVIVVALAFVGLLAAGGGDDTPTRSAPPKPPSPTTTPESPTETTAVGPYPILVDTDVRESPTSSAISVGRVLEGDQVNVVCTQEGDTVEDPRNQGTTSNIWDKLATPRGFVPDVYVNTHTHAAVAGPC